MALCSYDMMVLESAASGFQNDVEEDLKKEAKLEVLQEWKTCSLTDG